MVFNCGGGEESVEEVCGIYPDWATSDYVLPYPAGRAHRVSQGNCTLFSHKGTLRFSYDMEMPFGSYITAARRGVVVGMRMSQPSGSRGLTASNYIQVKHSDGMISEYVHLEMNSQFVRVGHLVEAGDTLARTGDTGDVGTWPHLHFDINRCGDNLRCDTSPITFRNTRPHPEGLVFDEFYEALPF